MSLLFTGTSLVKHCSVFVELSQTSEVIWGHGGLPMSLFQTQNHTYEVIWGAG